MTDPDEFRVAIDSAADKMVEIVFTKVGPSQSFDDWREWFRAALDHPLDPYPFRRAEEMLRELLK